MTHYEYIQKFPVLASTSCDASHMTFGNRCLNCGWSENPETIFIKHHTIKLGYVGVSSPDTFKLKQLTGRVYIESEKLEDTKAYLKKLGFHLVIRK